jgi:hypothetical protein
LTALPPAAIMDDPASLVNEKVPARADAQLRLLPGAKRVLDLALRQASLTVGGLVMACKAPPPVANLRAKVEALFREAELTYAEAVGRNRPTVRPSRGR